MLVTLKYANSKQIPFTKSLESGVNIVHFYLNNLVCCRFLMEGFVSNECGRFLFLLDAIAAAAATPIGPETNQLRMFYQLYFLYYYLLLLFIILCLYSV